MEDVALLRDVLAAGIKYDSPVVVATMRKAMVSTSLLRRHCVALFALACRHHFEEKAQAAAQACAMDPSVALPGDNPVLDQMSAGSYYRLLRFLQKSEAVTFCLARTLNATLQEVRTDLEADACHPFTPLIPGNDIVLKSCDFCSFYVHRAV